MSDIVRRNNFTAMRLAFSLAVIYAHAHVVVGGKEPVLLGRSMGNTAVHGFFVISGFLITRSYTYAPSLAVFFSNRILRIVPGLLIALLISYGLFHACDHYSGNPVQYSNGPLWTISWEVCCYIACAVLGSMGLFRDGRYNSFFASCCIIYLVNIHLDTDAAQILARLLLMFAGGAYLYLNEHRINYRILGPVSLCGLAIVQSNWMFTQLVGALHLIPFVFGPELNDDEIRGLIYMGCFPSVVIYLACHVRPRLVLKTDISYGVYILGWPIQETVVWIARRHGLHFAPWPFLLCSVPLIMIAAWLSWTLVEHPSLRVKDWIRRRAEVRSYRQDGPGQGLEARMTRIHLDQAAE